MKKCPRCDSIEVERTISGLMICDNCGQRWKGRGEIVLRQYDSRSIILILMTPLRRFLKTKAALTMAMFL